MSFGEFGGVQPSTTVVVVLFSVVAVVTATDWVVSSRAQRVWKQCLALDVIAAERHRIAFFRRWAVGPWVAVVLVVGLFVVLPGLEPGTLGLQLPEIGNWGATFGLHPPYDATVALLLVVGLVVLLSWAVSSIKPWTPPEPERRESRPQSGPVPPGAVTGQRPPPWGVGDEVAAERQRLATLQAHREAAALMPTSRPGRRWYIAMAVTTSVCDEVYYRGLFMVSLAAALPDQRVGVLVLLTAVFSGLTKGFTSASGAVQFGLIGLLNAWLFTSTGSLFPGMAVVLLVQLATLRRYSARS